MTDKIPESVMLEARDLFEDPHFRPYRNEYCIREVAKAILARDQRAAEIALAHGENSLDGPYWAGVNQAAVSISNAILSYDEAQQ